MDYKTGDLERAKEYVLRTVARYYPIIKGKLGTAKKIPLSSITASL